MRGSAPGDAAVDLAAELVRVDSVNPGLVPGAAGEAAIVDLLAARLSRSGFTVEVVPADRPGRPSLLATFRGTGTGRSLLLNGHLDTVGVDGMEQPFAGCIVGGRSRGRLLGRGACDMKAAVAAMVVAAEAAAAAGTAGDLALALVADEEHASAGTEAVLSRLGDRLPDACLVGEPTWLELAVAHRGYAVVEVVLSGRAAHSSQPALGVNATTHLGRLLGAVEARNAELEAGPAHPLAGTGSLLSTVAAAGQAPFMLASTASALVERRTVPGERAAAGLLEVEQILARLQRADPDVHGVASVALAREAWEYDPTAPGGAALSAALADALGGQRGRPPRQVAVQYWMESALWQAAGVPTVVCGPAGGGLHAAEEWVELEQVHAYTGALLNAIRRFCGAAP